MFRKGAETSQSVEYSENPHYPVFDDLLNEQAELRGTLDTAWALLNIIYCPPHFLLAGFRNISSKPDEDQKISGVADFDAK